MIAGLEEGVDYPFYLESSDGKTVDEETLKRYHNMGINLIVLPYFGRVDVEEQQVVLKVDAHSIAAVNVKLKKTLIYKVFNKNGVSVTLPTKQGGTK